MLFVENGPSIPDDLLTAQEVGDVIFFCGAGVSRARAKLPDFKTLVANVIAILGDDEDGLANQAFKKALEIGDIEGVGSLVSTDRVFSLLERQFEPEEIRKAVAEALKPQADADRSAHRILLDLW